MAAPSTLYRFRLKMASDLPLIDIRVAKHPSETEMFMVTRVLAYALNFQDGIEWSGGLSEPDAPAIRVIGRQGEILKWIDIGNPSARRLHKSAKAAISVSIYTYKDVERLKQEAAGEKIYHSQKIQIFALEPGFLEELCETLERDNRWQISILGNELEITIQDEVFASVLQLHRLS